MKTPKLKSFMRVETEDEGVGIIVFDKSINEKPFIVFENNTWASDANESFNGDSVVRIDRVWQSPQTYDLFDFNKRGILIWERNKKTIDEEPFYEIDGIEYSKTTLRNIIKKAHESN